MQKIIAGSVAGEVAHGDDVLEMLDTPPVPAAVLVPIILGPEPGVLLTKRNAHLNKHGGQVSFPGGRIDATDADAEAAALREAEEEIALDPKRVEVLGSMADYITGTGYRITPVLGLLPPGLELRASPHEVEVGVRTADRRSARSGCADSASATCPGASGGNTGCGRTPTITSGARPRRSWCTWRRSCGLRGRMLRLVELALFLAPFAAFAIWRFMAMERGPSIQLVAVTACVVVLLIGAMIWLSQEAGVATRHHLCAGATGEWRVIPGHAAPR